MYRVEEGATGDTPDMRGPSPSARPLYSLRPAVSEDQQWVDALTRSTMRVHVETTWPDASEQERYYDINRFRPEGTSIILCDGEPAGRLTLTRHDTHIDLEELHLSPSFQGKGIGGAVIRSVLDEARAGGLAVTLLVLRVNPAQRLYERLGFRIVSSTPERHSMRWLPESAGIDPEHVAPGVHG